jgi:hypothetical protein
MIFCFVEQLSLILVQQFLRAFLVELELLRIVQELFFLCFLADTVFVGAVSWFRLGRALKSGAWIHPWARL